MSRTRAAAILLFALAVLSIPPEACAHYGPQLGRFIQPDPAGSVDGPNPYVYATNTPTRYTDPSGEAVGHYTSVKEITPQIKWIGASAGLTGSMEPGEPPPPQVTGLTQCSITPKCECTKVNSYWSVDENWQPKLVVTEWKWPEDKFPDYVECWHEVWEVKVHCYTQVLAIGAGPWRDRAGSTYPYTPHQRSWEKERAHRQNAWKYLYNLVLKLDEREVDQMYITQTICLHKCAELKAIYKASFEASCAVSQSREYVKEAR